MTGTIKVLLAFVLALLGGCGRGGPETADFTGVYLLTDAKAPPRAAAIGKHVTALQHAPGLEFARGQHVALAWNDGGLYCRLWGRLACPDDSASISIRSQDSSWVVYLRFPLMILQMAPANMPKGILATRIDDGKGPQPLPLGPDQFKWLPPAGRTQQAEQYDGAFRLSWDALGCQAPPTQRLIVIVRKIAREPPGAVFTLDGGGADQPKSD